MTAFGRSRNALNSSSDATGVNIYLGRAYGMDGYMKTEKTSEIDILRIYQWILLSQEQPAVHLLGDPDVAPPHQAQVDQVQWR